MDSVYPERSEYLVAEIAKDEIKLKTFCSPQMRYSERVEL